MLPKLSFLVSIITEKKHAKDCKVSKRELQKLSIFQQVDPKSFSQNLALNHSHSYASNVFSEIWKITLKIGNCMKWSNLIQGVSLKNLILQMAVALSQSISVVKTKIGLRSGSFIWQNFIIQKFKKNTKFL